MSSNRYILQVVKHMESKTPGLCGFYLPSDCPWKAQKDGPKFWQSFDIKLIVAVGRSSHPGAAQTDTFEMCGSVKFLGAKTVHNIKSYVYLGQGRSTERTSLNSPFLEGNLSTSRYPDVGTKKFHPTIFIFNAGIFLDKNALFLFLFSSRKQEETGWKGY